MYGATTLAITGYRDEPVPHTFLRQDQAARHVAILLPGIGYSCDMPLLYYPARLLLARGADVLRVEYGYQQRADFKTATADEQGRWVVADVTAPRGHMRRHGANGRARISGGGDLGRRHLIRQVDRCCRTYGKRSGRCADEQETQLHD